MSKIMVYHGSSIEVSRPDFRYGRYDADFGVGFYLTKELKMAEKWASRKRNPIINKYILDTDDLLTYEFGLDESWLNFVVDNRGGFEPEKFYEKFDLIIGATADDKLFSTIEQYESGFISSETAVKILNCIEIGKQICIKTEKALEALSYIDSYKIESEKVAELIEQNRQDRQRANELTGEIIRKANRRKSRGISL